MDIVKYLIIKPSCHFILYQQLSQTDWGAWNTYRSVEIRQFVKNYTHCDTTYMYDYQSARTLKISCVPQD